MRTGLHLLILLSLLKGSHLAFAQNSKIDSLINSYKSEKIDTNKVNTLTRLCWEYRIIGQFDSALHYGNTALDLGKQINYQKGIAASYNNIGAIHTNQGNFDKALDNYFASLKIKKEEKDKKGIASSYNNIGNIYVRQGNYDKALENYFASLKIKEELGDKKAIAASYNNIGVVYYSLLNFSKAMENYSTSLKFYEEIGDKNGRAYSIENIGNIYKEQKNYQKALENYIAALKIKEEIGDKSGISGSYVNIGIVYEALGDVEKALENYLASLKIREEIGDKQGIATSYINIGVLYKDKNDYTNAVLYLQKGLALSKEIGVKDRVMEAHKRLSETYAKNKDYKNAFEYHQFYSQYKDSLFNQESSKQIAEMSTRYETEKKEQQITLLEKDSEIQKYIRNSFMGGFVLVLLLAGISLRGYKQKQKANKLLGHQKDIIEEKNKDIIDSIHYANRIQTALLKEEAHITEHLPPHFILFRPKDILSGDFYWSLEKQGHLYIAAADCTGHGVPGAMMSMLGIAFLNEITSTEKLQTPAEILDQLRDKIIKDLKSKDGITKDGMDISLIRLKLSSQNGEEQELKLQWSGAYNPLWIVKPSETKTVIQEVRGDKQPIGFSHEIKPFTNHEISLTEGDTMYLFTDGYADQFGGDKGKKFKYAKLKELLITINNKPIQQQKEILNETFENWKGNLEQVDDVCIIGVRV